MNGYAMMLSTAAKIRLARIWYFLLSMVRRRFGRRDQVRVRRRGVQWELDLREGIDLTIYTFGAFEYSTLKCLESLTRAGDTVIDIGANIGAHTLHLARLVGATGRVFAFEPTNFAVAKLRANLRANPELEGRVVLHHAFLGEGPGVAPAKPIAASWPVDGTAPDDAITASRGMTASDATTTSLDAVLTAAADPRIRLIKMDVDGHELEVLQGARRLLRTQGPDIVMELAPFVFQPESQFDAMVQLLIAEGYVFRGLGTTHRRLPADLQALRRWIPPGGSLNVVAYRPAPTP